MKDKIIEILDKYGVSEYNWKLEITDEIEALYKDYYPKEFIEWLHDNTDDTRDWDDDEYWWLIPAEDYLPIEEILQYWKTQIRDK